MKNIEYNTGNDLCLPLPVPNGTKEGEILQLSDNLIVVTMTPQATQALIDQGACVGLKPGQASCYLRGKSLVLRIAIVGAIGVLDKVYKTGAGVYTATATGNTLVGHALTALTTDGVAEVVVL